MRSIKFSIFLSLFTFLATMGSAQAAVSYVSGLKLDDISDYEAFSGGDVRCADAGSGGIYAVDDGLGCEAAGFNLVDIKPSELETFQPGVDSLLLTVDGVKDGELIAGTLKFTLVDPQFYLPVSGDIKAGNGDRFGSFMFTNVGAGMYEASFNACPDITRGPTCKGISNIEITFSEVPLPAAAWLFLTAVGGLGLARRARS